MRAIMRAPSFRLTFEQKERANQEMRAKGVDKVILCADVIPTSWRRASALSCRRSTPRASSKKITITGKGSGFPTQSYQIDAVAEMSLE